MKRCSEVTIRPKGILLLEHTAHALHWLILSLLCLLCVKGGWLTRGRNETLQTNQELFGGISIANEEL